MKKNLSVILSVILVFALTLSACGSEKAPEETTTAATVAATTVATETAAPSLPLELTSWTMTANTWSSPNGATINISAVPNYYEEGQKADFAVRLEGDDAALVPCQWDGTNYTASVDLNAANGYCYYVVLTAADGTATEVTVNTPTEPTNEAFINMEAALSSFCSIIVEDSVYEDGKLVLNSGKVQVQAPAITNNNEAITCKEVVLALSFNGELLGEEVLPLTPTETAGLSEASIENISFDIPAMEGDQNVELTMNAALSNGQLLSAFGGNWFFNEEGLMPVLG